MTTATKEKFSMSLEESIEAIPVSTFHYRLLLICGLSFCADAMEVSLLSFLSICAGIDWDLDDTQRASITSLVFAGELLGSLFWGQFADRYGRRFAFIIACCIISIGGFLSGAAPSYEWLLVFRALVGFGVGGLTVPFDLLAEFIPSSHRGRYLNYIEYFWTFGSLFISGMAWAFLSDHGWRVLSYIAAVPVTLSSILSIIYLPESPRWLMVKGRTSEAEKIINQVALLSNFDLGDFSLRQDFPDVEADATIIDLFKSSQACTITLPLWIVWTTFGFAYYGVIIFVSRLYATSSGEESSCSFNYSAIFVNACAEIVGVTLGVFIIDKLGRRWSQCGLYVLGGAAVFSMSLGLSPSGLLVLAWFARMFAMASSSATWVATPELFPTKLRATGHAICNLGARIGAFCSPYFVFSNIAIIGVGSGLACANFIAAFSSYMLPETSGKTLDSGENARSSMDRAGANDSMSNLCALLGSSQSTETTILTADVRASEQQHYSSSPPFHVN